MENQYLKRIQTYIPDEMDAFIKSLSKPMYRGMRINPKKITDEHFFHAISFAYKKSPFCSHGYYVYAPLGLHPYHLAGLFYLQEPSASSAVEVLDVQSDDVVLDLCAAPGGKSTQIAEKLDSGFLVSNEIDKKRAQILLSNMERMGVSNMLITNTKPEVLCATYTDCFDKVLVDAPCSGEGMMKKHEVAKSDWSKQRIKGCQKQQKNILAQAYKALKIDGILVYSTCTYAKEENEDVIQWFLDTYEDIELIPVDVSWGRPAFGMPARRIFPMDHGEGHFVCKLKKTSGKARQLPVIKNQKPDKITKMFIESQLTHIPSYFHIEEEKVYGMGRPFVNTKGMPVLRQGVYLGNRLKNRFEPTHAFYMTSDWLQEYKHKVNVDHKQMDDFMHGLEIQMPCPKGYTAVCIDGYPFGYGKSDGTHIKNKIPKGIRLLPNSHILNL